MSRPKLDIVRKSISLSATVAGWADQLAHKKGFGSNYSAYIADLIRHDWEEQPQDHIGQPAKHDGVSSVSKSDAENKIVSVVHEATHGKAGVRRK
jgi:hypothetical protein